MFLACPQFILGKRDGGSFEQHLACFGVIREVNHVFGCFQGEGAAEGEEEEETGVVPGTEGWLTGFLCFQPRSQYFPIFDM